MTRQQLHEIVDQIPEATLPRLAELFDALAAQPTQETEQAWSDPDYVAYVLEAIARGEAEADRGELISMEEAKQRMARWLKP